MKLTLVYLAGIATGIGLLIYFYLFNFDNMSETELVDSVLYWYVPLIFGIYGIIALRLKSKMGDSTMSPLKFIFSGKDGLLLALVVLIGCGGLLGLILLLIPLALFKTNAPNFDFKVALLGTGLCVALLWVFFKVLWPAL
ncbi:MAG: hypothetical protein AAF489_04860 [Bacteroidota bacterium]